MRVKAPVHSLGWTKELQELHSKTWPSKRLKMQRNKTGSRSGACFLKLFFYCRIHAQSIQKPIITSPIKNLAPNAQPQPIM